MGRSFAYERVLASSLRAQWELDDVLPADQELDFSLNFMPQALVRTAAVRQLNLDEQRTLNHICAHQYLHYFRVVEEFVLPFVLDHARPMLNQDDFRVRALLNFACEEAKHIQLFRRFSEAFARGFPVKCATAGSPERFQLKVLSHHPLAVALTVLMIEWMSQAHYLESIRDDGDLDPLFKSLLKHHWMEEAQHAKLDALIAETLAEGRDERELQQVMREFFQIASSLDAGLRVQAQLNVEALQRAIGRSVPYPGRLIAQQYAASRWTYLGSAMTHRMFQATLESISPKGAAQVLDAVKRAGITPAPAKVERVAVAAE